MPFERGELAGFGVSVGVEQRQPLQAAGRRTGLPQGQLLIPLSAVVISKGPALLRGSWWLWCCAPLAASGACLYSLDFRIHSSI